MPSVLLSTNKVCAECFCSSRVVLNKTYFVECPRNCPPQITGHSVKESGSVVISFRRAYIQSRCCKRRLEPTGRDVIQASGKAGVPQPLTPYLHELHNRDKAAAS
jgi:hypothetical protein